MGFSRNGVIKWGIIGPGNIARDFVHDLQAIVGFPHIIVGVMSYEREEALQFAINHQIGDAFDDVDIFLQEALPDIAYISTPHSTHYSYAMACLRRRVAVLCEKPWALNADQARRMISLAHTKQTFLMEGMWIRFLPSIRQVLALLRKQSIGKIHSLTAEMGFRAPREMTNRFYDPALGGGALLDLGIYPIYLSLLIFGMPTEIHATARPSPTGVDESCAMVFEYSGGAYAILESSIIKETRKEACLFGETGMITIKAPWNEKSSAVEVIYYDGDTESYPCDWPGRGFQYEINEVAHCLMDERIESELHSHATSFQLSVLLDAVRSKIQPKGAGHDSGD